MEHLRRILPNVEDTLSGLPQWIARSYLCHYYRIAFFNNPGEKLCKKYLETDYPIHLKKYTNEATLIFVYTTRPHAPRNIFPKFQSSPTIDSVIWNNCTGGFKMAANYTKCGKNCNGVCGMKRAVYGNWMRSDCWDSQIKKMHKIEIYIKTRNWAKFLEYIHTIWPIMALQNILETAVRAKFYKAVEYIINLYGVHAIPRKFLTFEQYICVKNISIKCACLEVCACSLQLKDLEKKMLKSNFMFDLSHYRGLNNLNVHTVSDLTVQIAKRFKYTREELELYKDANRFGNRRFQNTTSEITMLKITQPEDSKYLRLIRIWT